MEAKPVTGANLMAFTLITFKAWNCIWPEDLEKEGMIRRKGWARKVRVPIPLVLPQVFGAF